MLLYGKLNAGMSMKGIRLDKGDCVYEVSRQRRKREG